MGSADRLHKIDGNNCAINAQALSLELALFDLTMLQRNGSARQQRT